MAVSPTGTLGIPKGRFCVNIWGHFAQVASSDHSCVQRVGGDAIELS